MKKSNEYKLFNNQGQVENPEIAHEMANIEKPYREKRNFGYFKLKPKKKEVIKGEKFAEKYGEKLVSKKNLEHAQQQAKLYKQKENKKKETAGIISRYNIRAFLSSSTERLDIHEFELIVNNQVICFFDISEDSRALNSYGNPIKCTIDNKEAQKEKLDMLWKKYKHFITEKAKKYKRKKRLTRDEVYEQDIYK